jgi:hypothetical protein
MLGLLGCLGQHLKNQHLSTNIEIWGRGWGTEAANWSKWLQTKRYGFIRNYILCTNNAIWRGGERQNCELAKKASERRQFSFDESEHIEVKALMNPQLRFVA